jgi:hypothetical protein
VFNKVSGSRCSPSLRGGLSEFAGVEESVQVSVVLESNGGQEAGAVILDELFGVRPC